MSISSLSVKEKAIMIFLLLVVIAALAYIFGVRTLNSAHNDMVEELNTLQQRKDYLDQLKEENVKTEGNINELKGNITKLEQSFIADIKTENLEQYVLKVFEDSGSPYLAKVSSDDIQMESIIMADGSASNDSIICKRINVTYATTDGYEALQYNITPELNKANGDVDAAIAAAMLNSTGKFDETRFLGYDEFIEGLKTIEKADPGCVKISKISAKSTHGYMTLEASIDFYSARLTNRISAENRTSGFAAWKGETNVDTEGGFIGMPYKVKNPLSRWNGVLIDTKEVTGFLPRPFAAYISNARFTQLIAQKGLAAIVGGGTQASNEKDVPQDQDANGEAA